MNSLIDQALRTEVEMIEMKIRILLSKYLTEGESFLLQVLTMKIEELISERRLKELNDSEVAVWNKLFERTAALAQIGLNKMSDEDRRIFIDLTTHALEIAG